MELDLENIVAIAHVIQSANGRVAGSRTVVLIGKIRGTDLKDGFYMRQLVAHLGIKGINVLDMAVGEVTIIKEIVLPLIH